jgi:GIY-YIG catalytic domain
MDENAYVSWLPTPEPWLLEAHLLETLDLPLNLDQNKRHPFHRTLKVYRRVAAAYARSLPVLPNPGVGGTQID